MSRQQQLAANLARETVKGVVQPGNRREEVKIGGEVVNSGAAECGAVAEDMGSSRRHPDEYSASTEGGRNKDSPTIDTQLALDLNYDGRWSSDVGQTGTGSAIGRNVQGWRIQTTWNCSPRCPDGLVHHLCTLYDSCASCDTSPRHLPEVKAYVSWGVQVGEKAELYCGCLERALRLFYYEHGLHGGKWEDKDAAGPYGLRGEARPGRRELVDTKDPAGQREGVESLATGLWLVRRHRARKRWSVDD